MADWIDISIPLKSGMVHWPGDPEIRIERVLDIERGDHCNVSSISDALPKSAIASAIELLYLSLSNGVSFSWSSSSTPTCT